MKGINTRTEAKLMS